MNFWLFYSMVAHALGAPYYPPGPPVQYSPPGYSAPMPPRALPPRTAVPRELTRDEERDRIIDAGEAFCRRYPTDRVCHPQKE
jgi:hypothetical protein